MGDTKEVLGDIQEKAQLVEQVLIHIYVYRGLELDHVTVQYVHAVCSMYVPCDYTRDI